MSNPVTRIASQAAVSAFKTVINIIQVIHKSIRGLFFGILTLGSFILNSIRTHKKLMLAFIIAACAGVTAFLIFDRQHFIAHCHSVGSYHGEECAKYHPDCAGVPIDKKRLKEGIEKCYWNYPLTCDEGEWHYNYCLNVTF